MLVSTLSLSPWPAHVSTPPKAKSKCCVCPHPASLCSPASCIRLLLSSASFPSSMVAPQHRPSSPPGPGQRAWSWRSQPYCYLVWRTPPMSRGGSGLTTLRENGTSWDQHLLVLTPGPLSERGQEANTIWSLSIWVWTIDWRWDFSTRKTFRSTGEQGEHASD